MAEVATGAGKTYFAINSLNKILQQNPKQTVLIVCPKLVIMDNWCTELYNYFDFTEIGFYYGEIKEYAKITLTTNASVQNVNLDIFDILIVDEIHNAFTPKFNKVFNKDWNYMLGLSATLSNENEYKHWKFLKYFNYNRFSYNTEEALRDEILNPFDFHNYSVGITEPNLIRDYNKVSERITNIIRKAGSYNAALQNPSFKKSLMFNVDKRNKLVFNYHKKFNILKNILLDNKDSKIIIFNQYNSIGTDIYLMCLDLNLSSRVVNSDLHRNKVQETLKDFRNDKFNILITSKMFDEGYNLPSLDVAIIFSGDSSRRQIVQRVGRVLRKKDNQRSKIYQIYVRNTFEEEYSRKRYNFFEKSANNLFEVVL